MGCIVLPGCTSIKVTLFEDRVDDTTSDSDASQNNQVDETVRNNSLGRFKQMLIRDWCLHLWVHLSFNSTPLGRCVASVHDDLGIFAGKENNANSPVGVSKYGTP